MQQVIYICIIEIETVTKKTITMTKDDFIFEITIITPLTEIVNKIKKGEYRDCDVDWLNGRLEHYTELALIVIGKDIKVGKISGRLNDYNSKRFMRYFSTLIKFFKQYS